MTSDEHKDEERRAMYRRAAAEGIPKEQLLAVLNALYDGEAKRIVELSVGYSVGTVKRIVDFAKREGLVADAPELT